MAKATQKKAPAKKPVKRSKAREPETKPRDAADLRELQYGRDARASGIDRRSCPHVAGAFRDAWLEGWDFENEARA